MKWSAATQAGTLVKILGEVDVKVKSVRGQVDYTALVVAGGQGILVLSEKDGRKLGIHVVGLLAGFLDERAAIVDDREWVEVTRLVLFDGAVPHETPTPPIPR